MTTVSNALSGKGRLPDATRERVRSVATKLGYRPDPVARSLAGAKTGLLATVVSFPSNVALPFTDMQYYVELINAATGTAVDRGYALVVAPSTAGHETWSRLPLDGMIVIDPADNDPSLRALRHRGLPIVLIGGDRRGEPGDIVVENDRRAATWAMLDHLRDHGADRVSLMTMRTYESFTEDCRIAYREWCRERNEEPVEHVAATDSSAGPQAFRDAARDYLDRADWPDAVFCLYEKLAVELLGVARTRGVEVPGELMVAGISEMGLADTTHPTLTTLEVNQDQLGAIAASLLIDQIEGRTVASVRDVPTHITARASTARRSAPPERA